MFTVVAGICYKNSSDDGATWSKIWQVISTAAQPTVVCNADHHLVLQYNVRLKIKYIPLCLPISIVYM